MYTTALAGKKACAVLEAMDMSGLCRKEMGCIAIEIKKTSKASCSHESEHLQSLRRKKLADFSSQAFKAA